MSRLWKAKELFLPWSGLIGAFAGWALTHQVGSNTNFDRCHSTPLLPMALLGLAGIAVIVTGGWFSWTLYRRGPGESGPRRFISGVAMGAAAIFTMALVWQTLSSFIIPPCFG